MNRRDFLKLLGKATVATGAAGFIKLPESKGDNGQGDSGVDCAFDNECEILSSFYFEPEYSYKPKVDTTL